MELNTVIKMSFKQYGAHNYNKRIKKCHIHTMLIGAILYFLIQKFNLYISKDYLRFKKKILETMKPFIKD